MNISLHVSSKAETIEKTGNYVPNSPAAMDLLEIAAIVEQTMDNRDSRTAIRDKQSLWSALHAKRRGRGLARLLRMIKEHATRGWRGCTQMLPTWASNSVPNQRLHRHRLPPA